MAKKKRRKRRPAHKPGNVPTPPPAPRVAEARSTAYARLTGPWYVHLLLFIVLVAATAWLYRGDLDIGFFHVDDPGYVTGNPWIKGATSENVWHVLTQPYFANYSPLHLYSYMLDHALAGESARAFHLSSNIWAGLVAGMLYLLGLVLVRSPSLAFGAALLFVAHPSHVEAVAWISSRKDIVAAAFALPAMLAYFQYRRGGSRRWHWYTVSLVLFLLAVAGKLSVVVVPGILFVFDLALERRRGWGMVIDKLPHALIILFFALRVMGAQPPTRHAHDLYTLGHSLVHNLVLLTGFGDYVMNRPRPDVAGVAAWAKLLYRAVPFVFFLGPLALWRRAPGMVLGLVYWVLFALVPPLVLSFVHPVTDRYMFFPSAGFVLLLAWVAWRLRERWGRPGLVTAAIVGLAFLVGWTSRTQAYLAEWGDPRSVWHFAVQKNPDIRVHQYLGTHYQDAADQIGPGLAGDEEKMRETYALAELEWADNSKLPELLAEWDAGNMSTPLTAEYQKDLRAHAKEQFEQAARLRGTRVSPNLYFRLGKLSMDIGELGAAGAHFEHAYREAQKHTSVEVRNELAVRSRHAEGLVYWRQRKYVEALAAVREAEALQTRLGAAWVPNIRAHREKLEGIIAATR